MSSKNYVTVASSKDKKTATIYCALGLLGIGGIHHFYVGNIVKGLLYFFTYGFFGIGTIIDLIKLSNGTFKDSSGAPLLNKNSAVANPVQFDSTVVYPQESNERKTVALNDIEETLKRADENMNEAFDIYKEAMQNKEESKKHQALYEEKQRLKFAEELEEIPRVEIKVSETAVKRQAPSDMPEIKFTNITRATVLEKLFPLVVIDVETTGFSVRGGDIIEVAAIKYDVDFKPIARFNTLLKSRKPIPEDATRVNNITDDMVKDCPYFSKIVGSLSEFIAGCNIVGQNLSFDLKFLFVCGLPLPEKGVKYYDTLDLAKKTLVAYGSKKYDHHTGKYIENEEYDVFNYKLETLCEYYRIYRDDAHRALSDCHATAKVLENIIEDKRA